MDMDGNSKPAEVIARQLCDKAETGPTEDDIKTQFDATETGQIESDSTTAQIDAGESDPMEGDGDSKKAQIDNNIAYAADADRDPTGDDKMSEGDVNKGLKDLEESSENIKEKSECGDKKAECKPEERPQDFDPVVDIDFRVVEILKTVSTYKSLALNKSAHSLLLKEDVLIGQLVLFLGNDSPEVVTAAFEVVKILYHNRCNHVILKSSLHFLEALIVVSRCPNLSHKIRGDAKKIHDIVRSSKPPLSQSNITQNRNLAPTNAAGGPHQDDFQGAHHRSGLAAHKGNRSRNNDRETVISINPEALHHAIRRQEITTAVVKIKGIVSVTYNLNRKHCIIRAKAHVPSEVFGKTIANLGVECYLVRRNENKEEVLLKMEADLKLENNLSSLEQENVPSYLPDDDDEEEDENLNKNDMVARGDEVETTMTGKISNFLRKSFFW